MSSEWRARLTPVFLQQQLEWREQLEEAKSLGNTADLKHIKSVLNEATQQLIFNLSDLIDRQGDFKAAAQRAREGMFIDKFSHELDLVKDKFS
jgi:molecular chaperone HscB